jgi:hypothetical protein
MHTVASREAPETERAELDAKLATIRRALEATGLSGVRLRSHDWFAWVTCGGSNAVLTTSELGVAEVFVTPTDGFVLTDAIEAARLEREELPRGLTVAAFPWARPEDRGAFVCDHVRGGPVASDAPCSGELPLPDELTSARRRLHPAELDRYRVLGRVAAEAMTEVLEGATPEATERDLAGAGAEALLRRGIHPALILVAGSRRLPLYRHPTPTEERLGDRAMVVFCGRRHGLFANLTRFVSFRGPTPEERRLALAVATVEAAAWEASVPGRTLGDVYDAIVLTYARLGFAGAELEHHQGGITGYRSREVLAVPGSRTVIDPQVALAWNPSLPGAKIEDTVVTSEGGLEVLTADRAWPTVEVGGRPRPDLLVVS